MSDTSVFDKRQLLTVSGDDEELASQVAGIFLFDMPRQLRALEEAVAANDAKTAERITHSVKGASATVGGEALRAAALVGEQLGHEGKLLELAAELTVIKGKYLELEAKLVESGYTLLNPDETE